MEGQATIHINASPDEVYALVSDVTRMGEWSPETEACEWVDGATSVTESFRVTSTFTKIYTRGPLFRTNRMVQGMMETLTRIKKAAEASIS